MPDPLPIPTATPNAIYDAEMDLLGRWVRDGDFFVSQDGQYVIPRYSVFRAYGDMTPAQKQAVGFDESTFPKHFSGTERGPLRGIYRDVYTGNVYVRQGELLYDINRPRGSSAKYFRSEEERFRLDRSIPHQPDIVRESDVAPPPRSIYDELDDMNLAVSNETVPTPSAFPVPTALPTPSSHGTNPKLPSETSFDPVVLPTANADIPQPTPLPTPPPFPLPAIPGQQSDKDVNIPPPPVVPAKPKVPTDVLRRISQQIRNANAGHGFRSGFYPGSWRPAGGR